MTASVPRLALVVQLLVVPIVAQHSAPAGAMNAIDGQIAVCTGDCNGNGAVTIDEIVTGVDMELNGADPDRCPAFECNTAGLGIFINCAVVAVRNALMGCGGESARTDGACCLGDCREGSDNCQPQSQAACCYYAQHSEIALAVSWCSPEQFDPTTNHCEACVDPCLGLPSPTPAPHETAATETPTATPNGTPYALSSLQEPCWSETGAGLLAGVRAAYDAVLMPRAEIPWPALVPFTVRLTYRGGAITCYPPYEPPPGSKRPSRRERVGVVVEVAFKTDNGAFAETVDSELRGGAHGGDLSFLRRPEEIEGTYRPDLPGYENVLVGVWGHFSGDWTNGAVSESGMLPGHASEYIPIAYWQPPNGERPD